MESQTGHLSPHSRFKTTCPPFSDQVSPFPANGLATESGTGKGGKGGKATEMLISSVGGCWREGAVTAVDHA
jgi:hypothetical protein